MAVGNIRKPDYGELCTKMSVNFQRKLLAYENQTENDDWVEFSDVVCRRGTSVPTILPGLLQKRGRVEAQVTRRL